MTYEIATRLLLPSETNSRPLITSYDTGDEHSLEHYVCVQRLVEEADEELPKVPATLAITASPRSQGA